MNCIAPVLFAVVIITSLSPLPASAQYGGWQHSGEMTILTTPDGANLPATASVEGFPLLVRLHKDWFDFSQAKSQGEDIRFANNAGTALAFQIEEWDAAKGTASIWVRVQKIEGNARQYCPAANAKWARKIPTVFTVKGGTIDTSRLAGPGLGFQ